MLRRWLIWTHRYVGIPLSVVFVIWFASGIVMMYTGGMPRITPAERFLRIDPVDAAEVRLTPAEAAARGGLDGPPSRVVLLTVLARPAYRFDGVTVFADTGERLAPIGSAAAETVALRFTGAPASAVTYDRLLMDPDQWTLQFRGALPAHRLLVDDGSGTEVYVSQQTAEVVMLTTRRSRALAWAGAIPHWFYVRALRVEQTLWTRAVVWTSIVGCAVVLLGLALGVTQFRWRGNGRRIPYAGWMWWHYVTGVIFGIVTLTWTFSGLMSMEPFAWTRARGLDLPRDTLAGGPLDLGQFPAIPPAAWKRVVNGREVKEVALRQVDGQPFYEARLPWGPTNGATGTGHEITGSASPAAGFDRLLIAADTMEVRKEPFDAATLVSRLKEASGVPVVETEQLEAYDSYYYSRPEGALPLPVLRVRFADPLDTWVYVDPAAGQIVRSLHRYSRAERWLFNGLHSLDFGFWYSRRPLWDVGVILLSIGGLASSGIGLWIGAGRIRRAVSRWLAPA
ncbi:MAG: hypothetical protein F4Z04_14590 [Acidobacteria bacterium]|nr:hypothetical protein [Acidobacteriota bacterium]